MSPLQKFFQSLGILFLLSFASYAQNCPDKPDVSLADANEENFTRCSSVGGSTEYTLVVANISTTSSKNKDYTIEWGDGTSNTYPANFNSASHTYKTQGSFTLKYTITSQNGCSDSRTYSVFNGSTPGIGIQSPNNTSECAPAAFTFGITGTQSNAPNTTYAIWFDDGTDTLRFTQATIPATITHAFTKSSQGKTKGFTMYAVAYGCIPKQAEVSGIIISTKPIPAFSMTPESPFCPGQVVKLNDQTTGGFNGNNIGGNTSGYRRLWSISPSVGWEFTNATNASSVSPSILFKEKGTYKITLAVTPSGTSTTCLGDSIIKNVVVQDVPLAPSALPVTICNGTTATLKAEGDAPLFKWYASATATTPLATGATFTTPVLKATTTYYVEAALNSGGCFNPTRTPVTVTVAPLPAVPTAPDVLACFGSRATLNASTSAGKVYWFATATSTDTLATGPSFTTPALTATTTYYVSTLSPQGCFSATRKAVKVTVQPLVTENTISAPQTLCLGETAATLNGTAPKGGSGTYTYVWESRTEGTEFKKAAGSSTSATYAPGALTQTTWFRRVVTSGSCTNISEPVQVTVVPVITNNLFTVDPQVVCYGQTTTFTGSVPAGGNGGAPTYLWEMSTTSATAGFKAADGANTGQSYVSGNLMVNTWFRRKVTIDGCSQASPAVLVTINTFSFPPTVANATICSGGTATLTATAPGGPYEWYTSATGGTPFFTGDSFTTPALTANATYFVQSRAIGNCSETRTEVKVTVLPAITNNSITGNQVVCSGSVPSQLIGSKPAGGNDTPVYTWESSVDGVNFAPAAGTRTNQNYAPAALTQPTWFRRKVSMGPCEEITNAIKVDVTPVLTQVAMPPDMVVCDNTSSPIIQAPAATGGNGTYTYKWEKSVTSATAGFTSADGVFTNETYAPGILHSTTWFRRITFSGSCQLVSSAVKVTVLPLPSAPIVKDVATCQNATATLTAVPSTTNQKIQWFDAATGGNLLAEGTTFTTPVLQANTSYYAQALTTNGCLAPARVEVKVTVTPLPAAPEAIAATVCHSEKSIIRVNNPKADITYEWFAANTGGTALFRGPSFTTAALTQSTTFYVQALTGGCAGPRTAVLVTVQDPIANNVLSGAQEVCAGTGTTTLTGTLPTGGTGTYTYQWESSTDGVSFYTIQGASQSENYTPGIMFQTTWFRRVVKSGTCVPQVSAPIKVTVSESIINNFIQDNQVIFINTVPAAFTGTTPTGGTKTYRYQWESSQDGVTFTAISGATSKTYASGALSQTTWFRRVVESGGCLVISNVVKVTVNAEISQNTIYEDQNICTGTAPMTLSGTDPIGGDGTFSYVWEMSTSGPISGFVTASGTSTTKNYNSPALTQTTWFRRKVSSGTITLVSNVVKVTVFSAVTRNTISTNQTICINTAPALLSGTLPTGGSGTYAYVWESSTSGPTSGFGTAFGNSTEQNYLPGALQRTTWFRRKVVSGSCADNVSNAIQVTVTAPQPPSVQEASICAGFTATLTAVPAITGTVVEWFDQPEGGRMLGSGLSFTTLVLKETTTFYVRSVTQNCASVRIPVKVNIPAPTANAGPDQNIVLGNFATLEATGGLTYRWSPATGLNNSQIPNPVAKPTVTTTYTVTVTTQDGCTSSDQVTINVLQPIEVPNGFTPNGDGINDVWDLPNLKSYPDCQVEVFNRWGNKVFESRGYQQAWEGRMNGQPLPAATYYYIIRLGGKESPITGNVTIIK
ncbi:gliding motility-associated C-terminal domain-containing protein [Rufibacter latericius]|uniref:Gliding motility-associated C-terminal domain-containing protein n=1 Tax=Rufibacter latericius TaxID=2487040 RepID=A0A3M9M8L7_9BACT|nr:gliding motility-associated C-terminal domain-containing protein [Rufibacter latericius]RNI21816.1 gliding motility-associated C-terminal domain-containing protein [Rufibacter latericius]